MVVDCSSSFKHKDLPPNPHPWSGLLFAGRGSSPDPAAGREDSKSLPQHAWPHCHSFAVFSGAGGGEGG